MENTETLNHNLATIANGLLLVWWGTVIMVDPLTIGMGAVGTGLIMLGVNAVRLLNRMPTRATTTFIGSIALIWGAMDTIFDPRLGVSFAILLVVIGLATMATLLGRPAAG